MRKATTFIRQLGLPTSSMGGNGRLYNWYAAGDAKFAPTDWKVPSLSEFQTLSDYLGGDSIAGGKMKEVGYTHWESPNTGADNSSNFTGLGSGIREETGTFSNLNIQGRFFTSTSYGTPCQYTKFLASSSATFNNGYVLNDYKIRGYSIRLLYSGAGTPSTLTDYDGNIYDVIHIGTQYWIKQNWKCTHLNDGTSIPEVTDNFTWSGLTSGAWCYYNNDPSYL